MQQRFPRDEELWRRQVEQLLMGLAVDRDRLWKMTPQIPDPEAGVAFSGPLSPYHFVGPGRHGASGSPLVGTLIVSGPVGSGGGTGGGTGGSRNCLDLNCGSYSTTYAATIAGVTGPCASRFNRTHSMTLGGGTCAWEPTSPDPDLASMSIDQPSANPWALITVAHSVDPGLANAVFRAHLCPGDNNVSFDLFSEHSADECAGTSFAAATCLLTF